MSTEHKWERTNVDWYTCKACKARISILADYARTKYGCPGDGHDLISAAEDARCTLVAIRDGSMSRNNQEAMIDEAIDALVAALANARKTAAK